MTAFAAAIPGEVYTVTVSDSTGPPAATTAATVTIAPAAPNNLVADGSYRGPQDIRLTWDDNATGETGFEIWQKTGAGVFTRIDITIQGTTAYIVGTLNPGTAYTYKVRAVYDPTPAIGDEIHSGYSELAFDIPN